MIKSLAQLAGVKIIIQPNLALLNVLTTRIGLVESDWVTVSDPKFV